MRGWLGSNERIVPTVPPGPFKDLQALRTVQQLLIGSETYKALGAIDEEIYGSRLRSITGGAKAFALI